MKQYTNAYDFYGGVTPYDNEEMIRNIVKPNLGDDFRTLYWKDDEYSKINDSLKDEDTKTLYISSSGQGSASINTNKTIIRASILQDYMIQGAIYVKE